MTGLSLRARATVVATALFGVTLALGALLLVTTLERHLTSAADHLAQARVDDLLRLAAADTLPADVPNVEDDGVAQVLAADGRVLAASPNITGRPAIAPVGAGPRASLHVVRAPDDAETETYRLWARAGPSPHGTVTAYVGTSVETFSEASARLRRTLWLGVPLVVALLGLVTWLVLGRVLARLDRIRAEVDEITDRGLDRRVQGGSVPDEVGRLAATMNAMLERLERAATRQRQLVADVSHDLQSPLAAQRVALELALQDPDRLDADRLRTEVLGATAGMEGLVRDLLALAAADDAERPPGRPVDLDTLVLEEAIRARGTAAVPIDTSRTSAAPVLGDPEELRRIVRNLVDNATGHAAGRVALALDVDGGRAVLDVVDDGPGVPPEHRERIFDRFYRADPARPGSAGSGLGLAIARALAERWDGTVELVDAAPGAHFRLVLPAWQPARP